MELDNELGLVFQQDSQQIEILEDSMSIYHHLPSENFCDEKHPGLTLNAKTDERSNFSEIFFSKIKQTIKELKQFYNRRLTNGLLNLKLLILFARIISFTWLLILMFKGMQIFLMTVVNSLTSRETYRPRNQLSQIELDILDMGVDRLSLYYLAYGILNISLLIIYDYFLKQIKMTKKIIQRSITLEAINL